MVKVKHKVIRLGMVTSDKALTSLLDEGWMIINSVGSKNYTEYVLKKVELDTEKLSKEMEKVFTAVGDLGKAFSEEEEDETEITDIEE